MICSSYFYICYGQILPKCHGSAYGYMKSLSEYELFSPYLDFGCYSVKTVVF